MKKQKLGYKAFDKDLKCRDFQFKVGKIYTYKGTIKLCERGFHYCIKAADVFDYYSFAPETRVCEIEDLGISKSEGGNKTVTNKIKILREIPKQELLDIINQGIGNTGRSNSGDHNSGDHNSGDYNSGYRNSGYYNSGYHNSGDYNSGNRNSGNHNSGHYNSGHYNSGHYNSGHYNSGLFNTDEPTLRLFNKQTRINRNDPRVQAVLNVGPTMTEWVSFSDMTVQEKKDNPKAKVMEGYLKVIPYKEAWLNFWVNATKETRELFLRLPNFDAKIFKEITGIDVKKRY